MDTSIEIVTQNNAIALALGVNWGDGLSVDGVRTGVILIRSDN